MGHPRQASSRRPASEPARPGRDAAGRRRQSGNRGAGMKHLAAYLFASALALWLAATPIRAQQIPLQDKPFAEHKVVLQLSESDPKKAGLVVSVANNLMKFYDPDKVAIEIVAFGP